MKRLLRLGWALMLVGMIGHSARAADLEGEPTITQTVTPVAPEGNHPVIPRLKLSYVRFSIGNVDGSAVPLNAGHLDFYPITFPWVRGGFEVEIGSGDATFLANQATLIYGLVGLNAGVQLPGVVVTPFIEGRLDTGVLYGHTDGDISLGTGTLPSQSAATWMVTRGLDAGADLHVLGPSYVTLSLGWIRTTWGGGDFTMTINNMQAAVHIANVTYDSFLLKAGIGI
jgi:hypothetical protein